MFLKNRNISSKIKRSKVKDYAALNIKMYCFVVKLIEIKFSIFLNFFDVISKLFRSFFDLFFLMFCLSILCLFYIFAFLCFVVLYFVIDPSQHML